jgi:outer membrane protein assembly factor BamB
LALDGEGGVLVTGAVDHDGDESNFNDNIYTVKRDATTGDLLWTHEYGETCLGCYDVPSDVVVDPEGHVFVAGSTSSPPYGADVILMVLDVATGLETDRGIVSGGPEESAGSGGLAFDAAFNLYDGGGFYNFNTGEIDMSVTKWPSMTSGDGTVIFAEDFESGTLGAWAATLQ